MDFFYNYDTLKKNMKCSSPGKVPINNFTEHSGILPFTTRKNERPEFKNGFIGVLGEFTRLELGKYVDSNFNFNSEKIINDIIMNSNIKVEPKEDKEYLEKLIKEYLFDNDDKVNILNPKLLLYLPNTHSEQGKGEKKIAEFIKDVFFKDEELNNKFKDFIKNSDSNHIIINLIIQNIPDLKEKEIIKKYEGKLNYITNIFKEDILFLLSSDKNKNFFLKNIEYIFAYYYFYYISQVTIKLNKNFNVDLNSVEPTYYILDNETLNKSRKAYNHGYRLIKRAGKNLLVNKLVMEHLNTLFGEKCLFLPELNELFDSYSYVEQNELLKYVTRWIRLYRERKEITDEPTWDNNINNIDPRFTKVVDCLFKSLEKGASSETKSRYPIYIRNIAKRYFIKRRGALGYSLNLTQDTLLVITALCIKEDKIKLTSLFKEYEKRGIFLDKNSKKEVEDLFNKLNLIDKKSDSGDAQYVKAIL